MSTRLQIKKINKNIKSDSNTLLQNQQKTDNCDSHHEKHDCEECDHEFSKKHEHSVMTVFAALKLNAKLTCFVIILKMIIHHSKEF